MLNPLSTRNPITILASLTNFAAEHGIDAVKIVLNPKRKVSKLVVSKHNRQYAKTLIKGASGFVEISSKFYKLAPRSSRINDAKALRTLGWTQSAIADALGVAQSTVSRWVRSK